MRDRVVRRPVHLCAGIAPTIVVALVAAVTPSVAAESAKGTLAPRVKGADGGICPFTATLIPKDSRPTLEKSSDDGAPLELLPGRYAVKLRCKIGDNTLAPPITPVKIVAGKTKKLKVKLKKTRFRVMAKRGGDRIRAKIQLFSPGVPSVPLAEAEANSKFTVAEGVYDVRVTQRVKSGYAPSELRKKLRIKGKKVNEITTDLSNGKLVVRAKHNGKRASTSVRIFEPDGETEVASTELGQAVSLVPGPYVVVTTLLDAADFVADRKTIWIRPKKTTKHAASFSTGTLFVTVVKDGKPLDATVHLSLPGAADHFNFFESPGTVSLTPGTFDLTIEPKKAGPIQATQKKGVRVKKKKKTKLKIDLSPATLSVVVRQAGLRVTPDELIVVRAGGGEEVAEPEADGRVRLWPGRYEVVARLSDGTEHRDGPFEVELGQKLSRTVEISRGSVSVDARRGNAVATDAMVYVYKPGAKTPVAKARAQSKISLAPGTYDVKITSGHEWRWIEKVRIKNGKTAKLDARFKPEKNKPLPNGDHEPLEDDDLPAGDGELADF